MVIWKLWHRIDYISHWIKMKSHCFLFGYFASFFVADFSHFCRLFFYFCDIFFFETSHSLFEHIFQLKNKRKSCVLLWCTSVCESERPWIEKSEKKRRNQKRIGKVCLLKRSFDIYRECDKLQRKAKRKCFITSSSFLLLLSFCSWIFFPKFLFRFFISVKCRNSCCAAGGRQIQISESEFDEKEKASRMNCGTKARNSCFHFIWKTDRSLIWMNHSRACFPLRVWRVKKKPRVVNELQLRPNTDSNSQICNSVTSTYAQL